MITELTNEVLEQAGFKIESTPHLNKDWTPNGEYTNYLRYSNSTTGNQILLSPLPTPEDIAQAEADGIKPYYEGTIYSDFGEEYVGSIEGKESLLHVINCVMGNIERRPVKCDTPGCLLAEEMEGRTWMSWEKKCPYCENEFTFLD